MRALAVALVALLLTPAAAFGHATLQGTVPARGTKLTKPPAEVVFKFDEAVEASFGALRVFDAKGTEVQTGDAFHPAGKGSDIAVKLKPGLGDGTYTATYHVISADGHPVSSGFVFTVGEGAAPTSSLDELLNAEGKAGPATTTALSVARAIQYAAIALGLGTLIFFLLCWRPVRVRSRAFTTRLERLLLLAAVAGVLSALAALVLQGAIGEGTSFWSAAKPSVVDEVIGTRFGRAWGLGALAWLLVLGLLGTRPLREGGTPASPAEPADEPVTPAAGGAPTATLAPPTSAVAAPAATLSPLVYALAFPLFALALLPSLGGHTSVQSPVAILLPSNMLHVLAMSAWLGGIAVLVLALRTATSSLPADARTPLLAGVVARFSSLALPAIAVLLATGVIQAIVEVGSFGALLDTPFGRAVLIKIAVALGIVALGALNRRRHLPELRRAAASRATPGRAGVVLRQALRAELVLGVVALAATGALSSYPPSTSESAGPYSTTVNIGPTRTEVTVDPAKVGSNEMHLYLFDSKTGAPFTKAQELRISAALPEKNIAKLTLTPHVAGPGHYVVDGAGFGVAGKWTVEVTVRVSDFIEYARPFTVPIE